MLLSGYNAAMTAPASRTPLPHAAYMPRVVPCSVLAKAAPLVRNDWRRSFTPCSALGSDEATSTPQPATAKPGDAPAQQQQQQAGDSKAPSPSWKWEESDDAMWAYGAFFALLACGTLPALQADQWADLPYFIGLAALTVYIGAHRSLTTKQRQQLSLKQGALAPVFASISLFSVYLLIKFFPGFSIQSFLDCYFWLIGSIAITGATSPLLRRSLGTLGKRKYEVTIPDGLLLDEDGSPLTTASFVGTDVLAVVLAVSIVTAELASHHTNFTLNNMVACLVATDILQLVGLRSFRTAGAMLLGLLAYDVFWVFGSPSVIGDNVMLAVATSDIFTGPTRLLFPRIAGSTGEAAGFPFSLLGLGDIAVPGILACLALRYDATRSVDMTGRATASISAIKEALADMAPSATRAQHGAAASNAASEAFDRFADQEKYQRDAYVSEGEFTMSFGDLDEVELHSQAASERLPVSEAVLLNRPYFTPVIGAYVAGLLVAFAANYITNLGQPALLYIVPSTLGVVAITALRRQELHRVWSFTDVDSFGTLEAVRVKADASESSQQ